jgi:hypothetical protein
MQIYPHDPDECCLIQKDHMHISLLHTYELAEKTPLQHFEGSHQFQQNQNRYNKKSISSNRPKTDMT